MKRSLFDKIFLGFLFLSIALFISVVVYSTYTTRRIMVKERSKVLTNEALLIADQTVSDYMKGNITHRQLIKNLQYYSETLAASIWIADDKGIIIASSTASSHPVAPKNIFFLNQDFDMMTAQTFSGDFFGHFDTDVVTVAIPIRIDNISDGMLFMHSTEEELKDLQGNIIQAIYIPFLVMLVISFAALGLISGRIMRPIKKINAAAVEYSTGNFDVELNIKSGDEIGQLAASLEYMASELSKLEEYRKDFISNISHDFRSPLTSIKGYVEAIQDGTIPIEKQDRYLNIIVNETNRLSKLTTSLLELNKFDSYGIWLVTKDFDVLDLVRMVMNSYEGKCIEKGIKIWLNNHCEQTMVYGDKTKIQQVIYNLVDNAIKFTPEGKSIYITLTEKSEKIYISVKDEGCGISKEDLQKIWVRFYKADSSRGKDKQGTGLGLSITKEIIKAHNENINVVSTEGVGTEFTFSLAKSAIEKESGNEE